MIKMEYDVIVVGGGHAGCEACLASSRMGCKTLLITGNFKNIADMPCNPSIGGSAKGIVVREIDALGGEMGNNTDKTHIQIKMLNSKKGPAVRSLRAQGDKVHYPQEMLKTLENQQNLELKETLVTDLIVENGKVCGVITETSEKIISKKVILTTGTYLNSQVMRGMNKKDGGPHGERSAKYLSDNLKKYGLTIFRLKTGTPPRVLKETIDFEKMQPELGDQELLTFSNFYEPKYDVEKQTPCYLTYTNAKTHKLIMDNLDKCSLYGGLVKSKGPRYCPSVEDKVVKFSDKERHQIFIEPESLEYEEYYVGGFSTTMPDEIQEQMVHSMVGLENAVISKYGYAIEYDVVEPTELTLSLESKKLKNLYTAGQINGTSGYEEAAAQGLIAGINASLSIKGESPLILKRNEAYIGVLIDDLINKGITEPYRLLTSRAEFRLLLRHDNADIRLTEIGRKVGLINDEKYEIFKRKLKNIENISNYLENNYFEPTKNPNNVIKNRIKLSEVAKRNDINLNEILKNQGVTFDEKALEQVEISIKYAGYISKEEKLVEKMLNLESKKIPEDIDYYKIHNLATEAKQKMDAVRPLTIGQASRISGVNPADISVLLVYLRKEFPYE